MDFNGIFFDTTNYEITNVSLGKGVLGKVCTVKNINENKEYAVKLINTSNGFNGPEQMSFMHESLILHQLQHPSIVKFIGINFQSFTDQNKFEPSILTEYFPNGSLRSILNKEKQSESDPKWNPTKKYINLLGISNAMRYLHKQGILHCDLKPENILIDDDYNPHISDYGLSKCFSGILSKLLKLILSKNIGAPIYLAPELFDEELNEQRFNLAVDVFSFGIIAYEIVTAKDPYSELGKISSFKLIAKIISGYRPQFPDDTPEKMKSLILRCISKKIDERPTFDQIFSELSENISEYDSNVNKDEVNEYLKKISKEENELNNSNKKVKASNVASPSKTQEKSSTDNSFEIERLQKKFAEKEKEYADIVKVLMRNVDDVDDIEINDNSLLHEACKVGNLELVKYLVLVNESDLTGADILNILFFCNEI